MGPGDTEASSSFGDGVSWYLGPDSYGDHGHRAELPEAATRNNRLGNRSLAKNPLAQDIPGRGSSKMSQVLANTSLAVDLGIILPPFC